MSAIIDSSDTIIDFLRYPAESTEDNLVSKQVKDTNGQYDTEEAVSIDLSLGFRFELNLGSHPDPTSRLSYSSGLGYNSSEDYHI